MSLLLKNVKIVDPNSDFNQSITDIFIHEGVITDFEARESDFTFDLRGKEVSPGWFDLNAHFNDPGREHKEDITSGLQVAMAGGFTDVQLFPHTIPPIQTKNDVEYLRNNSTEGVDLHVCALFSVDQKDERLTEFYDLRQAGATAFSNGDLPISNAHLLLNGLKYSNDLGTPIFQNGFDLNLFMGTHMHEGKVSTELGLRGEPVLSEEITLLRDIKLLAYAGGHLHFTKISSAGSLELIREAKSNGLRVTCDTSIMHLLFNETAIGDFNTTFKNTPHLRSESDRMALIEGIKDGTIDAICSNHRPQDVDDKEMEFDLAASGMISLQTMYPALLLLKEEIPIELLIRKLTSGPRAILGKDELSIKRGAPARLTIMDPEERWNFDADTNLSQSINSPFWGQELKGKVIGTVNNDFFSIQ
jgi:dihydroorotase